MKFWSSQSIYWLATLFVLSCSQIEHSADVVNERRVASPSTEALSKTRYQILQNKNALRIALLQLEWGKQNSSVREGNAIVLESGLLKFLDQNRLEWDQLALARLHGQLVPELYKLLRIAQTQNLKLYVVCIDQVTCNLLKQNLSRKEIAKIKFLKGSELTSLAQVRPYLVISSNEELFKFAQRNPNWKNWKRHWIQLVKVDISTLVRPDDLARVVPTVHEF